MPNHRNIRESSYRYKQRRARIRRQLERHPEQAVCWICGGAIDLTAPKGHPQSLTLDHIVPLARGGVLDETRPAHAHCNSSRGDGTRRTKDTLIEW